MDNQHKKIKGYRDLSQLEIDQMNKVKELGMEMEEVIEDVMALSDSDKRWVNIARTDFQKGIMALVRSIARPESF